MEAKTEEKPAGKKKPKLLMIVAGGLILGGVGFGAFMFLSGSKSSAEAPEEAHGKPDAHGKTDAHGKPVDGKAEEVKKPVAAGEKGKKKIITREPNVVNLHQSNATRYLKIRIALEISNDAVANELRDMDPQISDFLTEKLSLYDITRMDNTAGRNQMRRELLTGINEILTSGVVEKIYFTEFVIQ